MALEISQLELNKVVTQNDNHSQNFIIRVRKHLEVAINQKE